MKGFCGRGKQEGMEELGVLKVREEIWGPVRGSWAESCQGLAAAGQDGGAEGREEIWESGEGFGWVSPARGCRAGWGGLAAAVLLTWDFPKPG